ncbi:hypothetical protein ABEY61_26950 [Bacillus toyonensis]|uniref:hypothetical protein n=1 Tax=Bacillus toyonensis TaxID=155322 RepID=UPI003D19ABB6
MKRVKEYDLAYICYYSERIKLADISAGFSRKFSVVFLKQLIQDLKKEKRFDFYKNMYKDLLNT